MQRLNHGIIVQARVGSKRLPGKVIKDFYEGNSILDIILNKLKKVEVPVVLATSKNPENEPLKSVADRNEVLFFRGSEEDVLQRFIDAGEKFGFGSIARICADNPFLSIDLLLNLFEIQKNDPGNDYYSFTYQSTPVIKTHFGLFAELTTLDTLKKVKEYTNEKFYHEHVTNYIYENPQMFALHLHELNKEVFFSDQIRLTIDTAGDFELAQELYQKIIEKFGKSDHKQVLRYLHTHKEYLNRMKNQIKKNQK